MPLEQKMIISTGRLTGKSLAGQVAVVTGAGGGIGFEAARALVWMGARVVIAEINKTPGEQAAQRICAEMGPGTALFIHTDVGDKRNVRKLKEQAIRQFGKVDIVLNNATIAALGAVKDVPIQGWDACYRVNLRGPVLLAQAFLPEMVARRAGVFVCVSSVGEAFMAAYESCKNAQVHLARALDAELEGSGVIAFTIGPGLVPTATAQAGVAKIAPLYGMTIEEFYATNKASFLSVEAAGAGFAAAIALATEFKGIETDSRTALLAVGIEMFESQVPAGNTLTAEQNQQALALCKSVRTTLSEQSAGWMKRPLFEKQWMLRDFKNFTGLTVEQWLENLQKLENSLEMKDMGQLARVIIPLEKLAGYYQHMQDLAKGYIKDPKVRQEQLAIVQGWQEDARQLAHLVENQQ
jgi:NAD(P)-dependent dehydrogenase (short-subunit alcohol dehydrogenase family)